MIPEALARRVMNQAIVEGRCAELFECLIAGGSATVDAVTDRLALIPAEALAAMEVGEDGRKRPRRMYRIAKEAE